MSNLERAHDRMNKVLGPIIAGLLVFIGGVIVYENRDSVGGLYSAGAQGANLPSRQPVDPADLRPQVTPEQLEFQKGLERSIQPKNFTLPEIQVPSGQLSSPPRIQPPSSPGRGR